MSSLHWAIRQPDWTAQDIHEHLTNGFFNVNETDTRGRTPLLYLLFTENCPASVIEVLLQHGANIEKTDSRKRWPLLVALQNEGSSVEVVKMLKNYGANLNRRSVFKFLKTVSVIKPSIFY